MMERDKRARFVEQGSEGDDPRSDAVRRALGDPVTWDEPPHTIADGVLAGIKAGDNPLFHTGRRPTWRRFGLAAAAVTVVILLLGFLGSSGPDAVVNLAGTELEPSASGRALLEPTDAGWSIRLELQDLPPADEGFYYEGWVWSDQGDGVSIGTFHLRDGSHPLNMWAGVDVEAYPSIWISLQAEGEGNEVSDRIVMVGRLER